MDFLYQRKAASIERSIRMGTDGKFSKRDTKPQLFVNDILDDMGITYRREYAIEQFSIDNYLIDFNLAIEVMGDFWHANPFAFAEPKFAQQKKAIGRDYQKRKVVARICGNPPLYLWENDINHRQQLIRLLIAFYVKKNGNIPNYNSFNYHLDESGVLQLNKTIILPHQEKPLKVA